MSLNPKTPLMNTYAYQMQWMITVPLNLKTLVMINVLTPQIVHIMKFLMMLMFMGLCLMLSTVQSCLIITVFTPIWLCMIIITASMQPYVTITVSMEMMKTVFMHLFTMTMTMLMQIHLCLLIIITVVMSISLCMMISTAFTQPYVSITVFMQMMKTVFMHLFSMTITLLMPICLCLMIITVVMSICLCMMISTAFMQPYVSITVFMQMMCSCTFFPWP